MLYKHWTKRQSSWVFLPCFIKKLTASFSLPFFTCLLPLDDCLCEVLLPAFSCEEGSFFQTFLIKKDAGDHNAHKGLTLVAYSLSLLLIL